ncbi:MAG: N-formylglutamate amidohydrolase [Rhodobiaceae bacterium]|nr:N-formylglutamate amidohydrolase [Rhodobiaceae bacterium]
MTKPAPLPYIFSPAATVVGDVSGDVLGDVLGDVSSDVAGAPSPILITSPHSGCDYPPAFLAASRLDAHAIRQSEDMFVAELFADAPAAGIALLAARYPRAYVDLNRAPDELEPMLFADKLPDYIPKPSLRANSGLGTVPRLVAENTPIYDHKLSFAEAQQRIESVYQPFHEKLGQTLRETHQAHGMAILLDAHSMPSQATKKSGQSESQIDFVLGNRHGRACDERLSDWVGAFLTARGWRVGYNKPYAGGFITEQYGAPARGLHALQIEINRAIYMDEDSQQKHRGFDVLRADIATLLHALTQALPQISAAISGPRQSAAE